jgi:hypothetical protein
MMQNFSNRFALLVASFLLAACGGDAAPGAAPDAVASGGGAPPAATAAATTSDLHADALELSDYTLTLEELERWGTAAAALARLGRENPELKERLSMNVSEASIDAFAERLEAIPEVRDIVEDAGFSPREYAVTTYVVVQSMLGHAAIQQGMSADAVAEKAGINPENLAFVQKHQAEVRATLARVQGK